MSFKIFSLQLRGKIKATEKIEEKRNQLQQDFEEFNRVGESQELKDFYELQELINSEEFKKNKQYIKSLQFKGSKEENQLKEFEKLKKQKNIKNYFKVAESADLRKFKEIGKSDKLSKYNNLHDFVKNGEYEREKKINAGETFKGSAEEEKLKGFNKLKKSAGIKAYYEINDSAALKTYKDFLQSAKLRKYKELKSLVSLSKENKKEFKSLKSDQEIKTFLRFENSKKYKLYKLTEGSAELERFELLQTETKTKEFVEKVDYLKDKKKFEKTEAFKKFTEYNRLKNDSDIKFYFKFEKSGLYKNYLDVSNSADLKRFNELKTITGTEEFLAQKAYLEDKNKWEKTEEYKKELKYGEMKNLPQMVKYFSYKDTDVFDFFKKWEVSFSDDFSGSAIDTEKWLTTSYVGDKLMGDNYSMPGDLHVFTNDGSNLKVNKKLSIQIKREKHEAKIWKMPAGFVTADMDYTSGTISSGKSFWQTDGIFEAKIKFAPVNNSVSSIFLSGEENMPRITMLESGSKNRMGISTLNKDGKIMVEGIDISNLKKNNWYIFTLEKTGSEICWKVNDTELFRTKSNLFDGKLQLNANSIVLNELPGSQLPASFEIEWIKCYQKK